MVESDREKEVTKEEEVESDAEIDINKHFLLLRLPCLNILHGCDCIMRYFRGHTYSNTDTLEGEYDVRACMFEKSHRPS